MVWGWVNDDYFHYIIYIFFQSFTDFLVIGLFIWLQKKKQETGLYYNHKKNH